MGSTIQWQQYAFFELFYSANILTFLNPDALTGEAKNIPEKYLRMKLV